MVARTACAAAGLAAGACASPPVDGGARANPPEAPAAVVEMTQTIRFSPDTLRIGAGQTVEWSNVSVAIGHTVTALPGRASDDAHVSLPRGAAPFDSGNIPPGGTWRRRFDVPGTYLYYCTPHELAGMVGVIVVAP
jgi:plastocyanin